MFAQRAHYVVLAISAILLARIPFFLFDDPEGPNLLVVGMAAALVYGLSLLAWWVMSRAPGVARLLLAIGVQVLAVGGFYLLMR